MNNSIQNSYVLYTSFWGIFNEKNYVLKTRKIGFHSGNCTCLILKQFPKLFPGQFEQFSKICLNHLKLRQRKTATEKRDVKSE